MVNERLFNRKTKELLLNNYPHIQFIHIQENSLERISSLTISNLPELTLMIIENHSLYETPKLTLSSCF